MSHTESPAPSKKLKGAPSEALPANVDAERYLLGAILVSPEAMHAVRPKLDPDDFFLQAHRMVYAAMCTIYDDSGSLDLVTIAEELNKRGQLEAVGGYQFLVYLDDGMPRIQPETIQGWAKLIREKAAVRRVAQGANELLKSISGGTVSPEDLLPFVDNLARHLHEHRNGTSLATAAELLETIPGGAETLLGPTRSSQRIDTGFYDLDRITGGFKRGELVLIGARPAMGKTSLLLNMAEHMCLRGGRSVAFFTLEMSREVLLRRMLCSMASVSLQRLDSGDLDSDQRMRLIQALDQLTCSRFYIDETPSISLIEMRSRLRSLAQSGGLDVVMIDYLQLMTSGQKLRNDNHQVEINRIANGLKQLAKELDVVVVACSQLSRALEYRHRDQRPRLSDLRDSGGLEQAADTVLFLFREEVYRSRPDLRGQAELIVAKQRNGPTGTVRLVWRDWCTKFLNAVKEDI